nr:RNA-directed DNA polymerase [Tanacetum cinerariifolium]
MGFQYSVENVMDHLTTNGITAILGEIRSIEELEGMRWNLKPPEQTSVRVPSRVAVNKRLNRSVREKWSTLGEPSEKWDYYVRYDVPINTTPIEEVVATGWGEEFLDEEVTPGKLTILNEAEEESDCDDDERSGGKTLVIQENFAQNQQDFLDEYLPQWDDQLATQKQRSELEWENPFAAKRGEDHTGLYISEEKDNDLPYPKFRKFEQLAAHIIKKHKEHAFPIAADDAESSTSYQPPPDAIMGPAVYPPARQNPQQAYKPDYQFGYPQGKGNTFYGGYGEYHNSQWTLPPAWTESGVMLTLPADPGLWSDVISRWESITINRLNSQTWSDNKAKFAFVENLLGESEKLMWQQWRAAYPGAYSTLKTIADDPQNITLQVRQLIIIEDPYRGSTDEQDKAYRDLDRITCEETQNWWSFLEDFRQLAIKSGKLYFPSTTKKLFAKLPPSLSKKIEELFKARHPGLSAGILPAIKFTHTFVSEMCKDTVLAKELRDLSFCSAIPILGHSKESIRMTEEESRSVSASFVERKDTLQKIAEDIVLADFDDSSVYSISEGEDMSRLNCPKCQLTSCALCAKNYLGKTVNVKRKQQHKPEEEKDFSSNEVRLLKEILKEKTEQVQQMIRDQAKEYYESKIAIKEKEELWQTERSLLMRDLTDALKIIDQLKAKQMKLEEEKDEEIRRLKAQLQEKKDKEIKVQVSKEEFPPLGNSQIARPFMEAEAHYSGSTTTALKIRKITNQLYNVKVEFKIPSCPMFRITAIIDTGASTCCINKKVILEEALEPLTQTIFFNGLNSRQQATHKIKQGYFLIEGNKFKIPLIYAFDMRDSNGIKMLIGANFLRSMRGGIRIEEDEITIYKKVTRIKTSNQTEIAEITELEVSEEEFLEINKSIYFNQE